MKNKTNNIGALILAAGESSRMKHPKSLLLFDKDRSFIDRITDEFISFGCTGIVIVINKKLSAHIKTSENIKVTINEHSEAGRFSSIKTGLNLLEECEYCFIHNVDNPFINPETLRLLFNNRFDDDYVYPSSNGKGGHPILISRKIILKIKEESKNDLNLREYLSSFRSKALEIKDDSVLININTLKDYKKYFAGKIN